VARELKRSRANAKRADKPNPREDRNMPYDPVKNPHGFKNQEETSLRPKKRVVMLPRNVPQEDYCEALLDDARSIVFAMGSAGTGKTLLATLAAIQGVQEGKYERVVITRPAVSVDENHGFLPGTLIDKMAPWVIPIMDVFKEYYHPKQVNRMLQDEMIEIAPLAFMRGRNLKNCFVIADEMQNATPIQMKMLLTRISEGSKMVVTGDLNQHDRTFAENGLADFIARLRRDGSRRFSVTEFGREHVERHPIIDEVLRLYGEE
jgi:phosphate starvation-inducible PhoH-like protein